jgi:hypothetical protein
MFERSKTHSLAPNAGPAVFPFDVRRDNYDGPLVFEGWISNFGSSNVHIMRGQLSLVQAQDLLGAGLSDLLMTLPGSGPARIGLPDDCDYVTLFFEALNTSGQYQAVTTRVYDRYKGIVGVPRA